MERICEHVPMQAYIFMYTGTHSNTPPVPQSLVRTRRSPTVESTVHHATSNPAAAWLCMSKRPFSEKPDKMQKDQSRCTGKITSPESVTTYRGERRNTVTRSTRAVLKTVQ